MIPIGTRLEITPRIPKLAINPSRQEITWFGEIEEAIFQIRHEESGGSSAICAGFVEVTVGGLLIGQIPVSISVTENKQRLSLVHSSVKMISRVFASYAREDLSIVRGCKVAYKGLGIHLFIDKDEILSGQAWRDVIRRSIGNHDLFQLFWSQAAADSSEVANEWNLALSIVPQRNVAFIRPLYWSEPMVEPPQDLAQINFTFLDTKTMNIEPEKSDNNDTMPLRPIKADFPVIDVIGSGHKAIDSLRHNISKVIPFLDHLIQARYYPPVSFLVDAHTVLTTRKALCCSSSNDSNIKQSINDIKHVISLLQSLALAFHVGKLVPKNSHYDKSETFFDVLDEHEKIEYFHIVRMTEWIFSGPVKEYFGGQNTLKIQVQSMQSYIKGVVRGDGSGYELESMLTWLLEVASEDDAKIVRDVVKKDMLKDLRSFESRRDTGVASNLLNSSVPQLAEKYQVLIFFHRPDRTDLRLCKTFQEYVAKFCKRWLAYIDLALSKQSDVEIDIGYSAPRLSLEWLAQELPNIQIVHKREEQGFFKKDEPQIQYSLRLNDYRRCVQYLTDLLLRLLDQKESYIGRSILPVAATTYGAFLPLESISGQNQFERTLHKFGWPQQACLASQGKVLVCNDAINSISKKLSELGLEEASVTDLADRIALSVLVHEHFHAAIATATGRDGRLPLGSQRWDDWQKGLSLNEALAAWAERHFFRSDPEMLSHIDAFIFAGEYPAWPYHGASFLEEVYRKGGLPSVRGWIRYLQDDPVNAQKEFDSQLIAGKG